MMLERHFIENLKNTMNNCEYLFCFTYAGGTTGFFDPLNQTLEDRVKLIKFEYAGHGKRYKERMYDSFDSLSDDLFSQLKEIVYKEKIQKYSLLGYSMGSISVVEILKRILTDDSVPVPTHVFLAAHAPLTTEIELEQCNNDEYIKHRTIQFGGVPKELLENKSFWRMYLPLYKADYKIIAKYRFEDLKLQCDIPTTIFYSETDTPYEDMVKWTHYFRGICNFVEYKGTHFFINEHYEEMANVIVTELEQ